MPACSGVRGERFYVAELARYLGIQPRVLHKYARRHRLLHFVSMGPARHAQPYVTELGALRLIAYARVHQGAWYVKGKDYHELNARMVAESKAARERKRAEAEKERQAQAFRAGLLSAAPVERGDGEQ